jgi:hypothetical protein
MLTTPPAPAFGARLVAETFPSQLDQSIQIIQLEPDNPQDLTWAKRQLRLAESQSDQHHLMPATTACVPAVGWKHIRQSWRQLCYALSHWAAEPPIALVAVNPAKQVVGLCLGHVERRFPGLQRQYTNFPDADARIQGLDASATQSQVEKLYSTAEAPGVGRALLTAYLQLLPDSIQQINLCALLHRLSPKAEALYTRMGFTPRHELMHAKRVDDVTPQARWLTFQALNTTPMSVARSVFQENVTDYLKRTNYKATDAPITMPPFRLHGPNPPATGLHQMAKREPMEPQRKAH